MINRLMCASFAIVLYEFLTATVFLADDILHSCLLVVTKWVCTSLFLILATCFLTATVVAIRCVITGEEIQDLWQRAFRK